MNSRGFTLIEMLVALLAASLLLVPLGWAIGRLGNDLDRADKSREASQFERDKAALNKLLRYARFDDEAGNALPQAAKTLSFRAPWPSASGRLGLAQWSLSEKRDIVTLKETDNVLPELSLFPDYALQEISLSSNDGYPTLVEITLLQDNEKKVLAVRPQITGNTVCDLDLVTRKCR